MEIISLHNVNLVFAKRNILEITTASKPNNKKDIETVLNFESITIEKMDKFYRIRGFKTLYSYVNFITFNTNKFADFEIKSFLGIKYVFRGVRQLFEKQMKEFDHIGRITVGRL